MTILRPLSLFLVGLAAWGLALGRYAAWDARRRGWLCGIVMVDEAVGLFTGIWLARNGTYLEVLACVAGAGCAAWLVARGTWGRSSETL